MADNKTTRDTQEISVESTLTRLLNTEEKADAIIREAGEAREQAIDAALAQTRAADLRFTENLETLRAPYLQEARAKAEQEIGELGRKYHERQRELRKLCEKHGAAAVELAQEFFLDPSR